MSNSVDRGQNSGGLRPLSSEQYATEDTLHSDMSFLQRTLVDMQLINSSLNLLNPTKKDAVTTCNAIYTLLLEHQRDMQFKDSLKQEIQRARQRLASVDKERARLESRLSVKEKELQSLNIKSKSCEKLSQQEATRTRKDVEQVQKQLVSKERKLVQMQHEIKRKERDFEKLQSKLKMYLADKNKNESTALDMAKFLSHSSGGVGSSACHGKSIQYSEEGLKNAVAAFERREKDLNQENEELRLALAKLQEEYKNNLNKSTPIGEDSVMIQSVVDESFLKEVTVMSADELKTELSLRLKMLQRRMNGVSSYQPNKSQLSSMERRLQEDLEIVRSVAHDQETLMVQVLTALRSAHAIELDSLQEKLRKLTEDCENARSKSVESSVLAQKYAAEILERAEHESALAKKIEDTSSRLKAAESLIQGLKEEKQRDLEEMDSLHRAEIEKSNLQNKEKIASIAESFKNEHIELQKSFDSEKEVLHSRIASLVSRLESAQKDEQEIERLNQALQVTSEKLTESNEEVRLLRDKVDNMDQTMVAMQKEFDERLASISAISEEEKCELERRLHKEIERSESKASVLEEELAEKTLEAESLLKQLDMNRETSVQHVKILENENRSQIAMLIKKYESDVECLQKEISVLQGKLAEMEASKIDGEKILHDSNNAQKEILRLEEELADSRKKIDYITVDFANREKLLLREQESAIYVAQQAAKKNCMDLEEEMFKETNRMSQQINELQAKLVQAEKMAVSAKEQSTKYQETLFQYQEQLKAWAPGLGAGLFLEKAVGRKAEMHMTKTLELECT